MAKLFKWFKRRPRTLQDMTMKQFRKEIRKNLLTNLEFVDRRLK